MFERDKSMNMFFKGKGKKFGVSDLELEFAITKVLESNLCNSDIENILTMVRLSYYDEFSTLEKKVQKEKSLRSIMEASLKSYIHSSGVSS